MAKEFELEAFLPYRLNQLSTGFSHAFADLYESRFGISVPEWRVIATLGRYEDVSSREICDSTKMDKSKVSRAVTRLIAAKLIAREVNPDDARLIRLKLTAKGRKLHREIVPLAKAWEERVLAGLSDKDRKRLSKLLSKLEESLSKAQPKAAAE